MNELFFDIESGITYKIIENNNDIFYNGSKWLTNNCGYIEIKNRINKKTSQNLNYFYICEFEDGTLRVVYSNAITQGTVSNPNKTTLYKIGKIGLGIYNSNKNSKEYQLWSNILSKCYNIKDKDYNRYGRNGVHICENWYNFQNFCIDIKKMDNYNKWLKDKLLWNLDKDLICEKENIHPKVYSINTCKFITREDNIAEANSRTKITGKTYLATRLSDLYSEEFINQRQFSLKYNLAPTAVCDCIKGKYSQHKGWKFEIKEEINE